MKALYSITSAIIMMVFIFTSCEPIEKISEVPEIHFKSYSLYQTYWISTTDTTIITSGDLVFSFIDGDANFGVDLAASPEDTINLVILAFQKLNGEYDSINADVYGRKYTVKRDEKLERTGQNKTIKGEIKVKIDYFLPPPFDTLKYDFYIVDRAGNMSNVESTTDIAF